MIADGAPQRYALGVDGDTNMALPGFEADGQCPNSCDTEHIPTVYLLCYDFWPRRTGGRDVLRSRAPIRVLGYSDPDTQRPDMPRRIRHAPHSLSHACWSNVAWAYTRFLPVVHGPTQLDGASINIEPERRTRQAGKESHVPSRLHGRCYDNCNNHQQYARPCPITPQLSITSVGNIIGD